MLVPLIEANMLGIRIEIYIKCCFCVIWLIIISCWVPLMEANMLGNILFEEARKQILCLRVGHNCQRKEKKTFLKELPPLQVYPFPLNGAVSELFCFPGSLSSYDHITSPASGSLPSPEKPSLKMRLFRAGDSKKKLLTNMFEKENSV